jgi:zinc transporter ZupT
MALTGGLLAFLGVEALSEALDLQATLPGPLGGPGLVLLGVAVSFLTMTWLSHRMSGSQGGAVAGVALATLVALGIGLHNLGEGLAIGSSFALGDLALGTFLIVGFMIHNVTEGLGIAAPVAERGTATLARLGALALIAGGPAIVVFFAIAAGAALEVVVEVGRHLRRSAPGGLTSGYVVGGFLAGVTVMYVTGLLAA